MQPRSMPVLFLFFFFYINKNRHAFHLLDRSSFVLFLPDATLLFVHMRLRAKLETQKPKDIEVVAEKGTGEGARFGARRQGQGGWFSMNANHCCCYLHAEPRLIEAHS